MPRNNTFSKGGKTTSSFMTTVLSLTSVDIIVKQKTDAETALLECLGARGDPVLAIEFYITGKRYRSSSQSNKKAPSECKAFHSLSLQRSRLRLDFRRQILDALRRFWSIRLRLHDDRVLRTARRTHGTSEATVHVRRG